LPQFETLTGIRDLMRLLCVSVPNVASASCTGPIRLRDHRGAGERLLIGLAERGMTRGGTNTG